MCFGSGNLDDEVSKEVKRNSQVIKEKLIDFEKSDAYRKHNQESFDRYILRNKQGDSELPAKRENVEQKRKKKRKKKVVELNVISETEISALLPLTSEIESSITKTIESSPRTSLLPEMSTRKSSEESTVVIRLRRNSIIPTQTQLLVPEVQDKLVMTVPEAQIEDVFPKSTKPNMNEDKQLDNVPSNPIHSSEPESDIPIELNVVLPEVEVKDVPPKPVEIILEPTILKIKDDGKAGEIVLDLIPPVEPTEHHKELSESNAPSQELEETLPEQILLEVGEDKTLKDVSLTQLTSQESLSTVSQEYNDGTVSEVKHQSTMSIETTSDNIETKVSEENTSREKSIAAPQIAPKIFNEYKVKVSEVRSKRYSSKVREADKNDVDMTEEDTKEYKIEIRLGNVPESTKVAESIVRSILPLLSEVGPTTQSPEKRLVAPRDNVAASDAMVPSPQIRADDTKNEKQLCVIIVPLCHSLEGERRHIAPLFSRDMIIPTVSPYGQKNLIYDYPSEFQPASIGQRYGSRNCFVFNG